MGNDATLTIRGTIHPTLPKTLVEFCDDWLLRSHPPAPPKDPFLRSVHENLGHILQFADLNAHGNNLLAVDADFRCNSDDILLLQEFLQSSLVELEHGWFHDTYSEHTLFHFDTTNNKLSTTVSYDPSCEQCASQDLDETDGANLPEQISQTIDPQTWRQRLSYLLEVIANKDTQMRLFGLRARMTQRNVTATRSIYRELA